MQIPGGLRRQTTGFTSALSRAAASRENRVQRRSFAGRVIALLRSGDEGQSIVEFALVLPLLMTILFCMYSLTMALYQYQQLEYATFFAAQQVGAGRGLLKDPCNTVATTVAAALPSWTASKFTYTVFITNSSGTSNKYGPTAGSGFSCTAGAANMSANQPITVGVSYQYTWIPAYLVNMSGNLTTSETVLAD